MAPGEVDGLDDVERGGELDEAGGIARRQVEVDDRGQAGLGRVDREVGLAEQALIGAGIAEGDAPGEGLPALDVEPDLVLCHHEPPGCQAAPRPRRRGRNAVRSPNESRNGVSRYTVEILVRSASRPRAAAPSPARPNARP